MEIFQKHFPEKECRIIFSPGKLFWQNAPERPAFPGKGNHHVTKTAS
jgi:hypothetical protein